MKKWEMLKPSTFGTRSIWNEDSVLVCSPGCPQRKESPPKCSVFGGPAELFLTTCPYHHILSKYAAHRIYLVGMMARCHEELVWSVDNQFPVPLSLRVRMDQLQEEIAAFS